MTPQFPEDHDTAEMDAMLRDLFRDTDEPRIATNLSRRAMELAIDPKHHAATFVRRCVMVFNVLGVLLIAIILWNGYQSVIGTFDTTTSTVATTTTSTTSTTLTVLEIFGAALLLFAAAGTQWAFRSPANESYLLPVGE